MSHTQAINWRHKTELSIRLRDNALNLWIDTNYTCVYNCFNHHIWYFTSTVSSIYLSLPLSLSLTLISFFLLESHIASLFKRLHRCSNAFHPFACVCLSCDVRWLETNHLHNQRHCIFLPSFLFASPSHTLSLNMCHKYTYACNTMMCSIFEKAQYWARWNS